MQTPDFLQRFLLVDEDIRGAYVDMTQSVHEIMEQHQYPAPIRRILGECLVVCTLLTHSLKVSGELTIELRAKSKIKLLVAKCNDQLQIRGLAQWDDEVIFDDLPEVMRTGDLVVTMMPDHHVEPLQSIVSLEGGDVATAFEHYFSQSEQLPSAIRLQVGDDSATGFMLQQMPQSMSTEDKWLLFHTTVHTASNTLFTESTEAILKNILPEYDIELFPQSPVCFECHCSVSRMENAIRTLGQDEAKQILSESQVIVVKCEYCNRDYSFGKDDVSRIFSH